MKSINFSCISTTVDASVCSNGLDLFHSCICMGIFYETTVRKPGEGIDLEKAFDRVPRKVLEWAMRKRGIPEATVRAVMSLY